MSKGSGRVERRIGELFAAAKDRALSIDDLTDCAFALNGAKPDRKQRLSATRAAHRLLQRVSVASEAARAAFDQAEAEARAILGRAPTRQGRNDNTYLFRIGPFYRAIDGAFVATMKNRPSWAAYEKARSTLSREHDRFNGVLVRWRGGWRATEKEHRLYFHPADYPVRVWAVSIEREGVVWADAEIVSITEQHVNVRYHAEPARLDRDKLSSTWAIYRNVYFTSARSGYAAQAFDEMWRQRFRWHPDTAPALQMPLAAAIRLLGVPADFTREDIIAAFRRAALKCHPDQGGIEAQFIELVKARDRLLAALGTAEAAPRMPEFAPKGTKLQYRKMRLHGAQQRLGQSRRLTG